MTRRALASFPPHCRLTVELKNDYVLGFIICEILTVIALQDWVSWGIFIVILGYQRRANSDSQHLEAHLELQDWLRSELFTVKMLDFQERVGITSIVQ